MTRRRVPVFVASLFSLVFLSCSFAIAQTAPQQGARPSEAPKPLPTITEKTAGFEAMPGYFPLYWDTKAGKLWLEIGRWQTEFLYVDSLPAGLGSNDVGLDRGRLGGTRIVRFDRIGPRVLLVQPNYDFRATSDNPDERAAVRQAFAESVLWGFDVAAEEGERVLVDATSFYLRDSIGAISTMRRTQQGTFRLDASRCAIYLPRTKSFPLNTEVEATLTFASDDPGPFVRSVTPSPEAVTLRLHHSFVQLPGPGFKSRRHDSRSSFFGINYMDFASPVGEPIMQRFIARHRLQKKDPSASVSEPVRPILYYLDRGVPEPIRSALLDGARWWNQAFEAAGYRNAFRVEMLPEDADPMDVRYNLIQWVHRSTRGWSYGSTVTDPRTGEIIKGQVSIGSLRIRQDYLIAEGLLAPYEQGKPVSPKMLEMALARIRQLAAHEVGHTLGLMHNYAASMVNRSSVMDYPHPLAKLGADGSVDLSDAYATGIGEWDKVSITYGYQDFPQGTDETASLNKILNDASSRGLLFLTDQDARPPGSASPAAHLWDNGANAVDELKRIMKLRSAALERFSEKNIREGAPMATLEDVLVPVYLMHRYQLEAASKVIGGLDYAFTVRGQGGKPPDIVLAAEQRRALDAVLETLKPGELALQEALLRLIPPRPAGYGRSRELFRSRTGIAFDALSPVETAAHLAVSLLLNPDRAARMVEYHARDPRNPGFEEVLEKLLAASWKSPRAPANFGYAAEVERTIDSVVLADLFSLAADTRARPQVRALAHQALAQLQGWLTGRTGDPALRAHYAYAAAEILRFQKEPDKFTPQPPLVAPDGQPIGMWGEEFLNSREVLPSALAPWLCDWR